MAMLLIVCMLISTAGCALSPETAALLNEIDVSAIMENGDIPLDQLDADTLTKIEEILEQANAQDPETDLGDLADTTVDQLDRDSLEQIIDVIGDGTITDAVTGDMSDDELRGLVKELLSAMGVQLPESESGDDESETPKIDLEIDEEAYDENGAMKEPFDQVYPDLIEDGSVEFDDETLLIKMNNSRNGAISEGMKAAGVVALEAVVPMDDTTWYEAKLVKDTDPQEALAALRELGEIILAEYNYQIRTAKLDEPKKPDHEYGFEKNKHNKDQWFMDHCGIADGYDEMETLGGDPGVVVAVIDSGVDYDHEDLAQNIWVNTAEIPDDGKDNDGNGYIDDYYGYNAVAGKGSADDDNGHGTHVAGIIAAQNNNVGVVGIAYNVKIMPVKAAMASGYLNQSDIAESIIYAYENGAEVINMSFGGTACSIAVQDALATAYTRCVLVASAGNDGAKNEGLMSIPNYPGALSYVLGVMSVDQYGVESSFTNWDVRAFNGIEYELYAPGEAMMSTLPNDQYGKLSGTSMAAPVVSAMAAILRSEFTDRDMYPTKFIYGQLASTSEYHATCLDPELHGLHNLPQIVDLNAALTKMPKPELNMQDYALFDTAGLANDDAGVNNGDGVIDAGETVALGLTLRNRWGMSEDTIVTISTANNGIEDPYITVLNPTVDYGSVGTYSTQDCGKIYTDEMFTAWEDPFYIRIAEDCPNDYIFNVHVTITCKNALDENDTTEYIWGTEYDPIVFTLEVRNGVVLPQVIEEDMTLTSDNLYIIPNSTVITEGTTVTVKPGTHIQFWSSDANDPYAQNYIAYLLVQGNFLVEGSKDDPVYIYPSDLMSNYNVEMGATDTGYISLRYADVTNLYCNSDGNTDTYNRINYVDHCTFRINYGTSFYVRYLSSGKVSNNWISAPCMGRFDHTENSVFYKIGSVNDYQYLFGNFDRCIFVDCGLKFDYIYSTIKSKLNNCVMLGNTFVDQTQPAKYDNTSITVNPSKEVSSSDVEIFYREETGTTYIKVYSNIDSSYRIVDNIISDELLEELGANHVVIETEDELDWIYKNLKSETFGIKIGYDHDNRKYIWNDGSDFDLAFKSVNNGKYKYCSHTSGSNSFSFVDSEPQYLLYELPGEVLPSEITFNEYQVNIDTGATYQLSPKTAPVQLPVTSFIYASSDESVVKVDEKGLVTPVGKGTADVYVYSSDRAVYNYVTFNVEDYVALTGLNFAEGEVIVPVGETKSTKCILTPADTTRRNVTYTSSDENVVTVDAAGNLAGVGSGTATITASCEGISATMTVTCYVKATSLDINKLTMLTSLTDGTVDLPAVTLSEGAETELVWESTDTEVAEIVDGKLKLNKEGTTTLIVTDLVSGLSDNVLVAVQTEQPVGVKKIDVSDSYYYVLLENGDLYYWNQTNCPTPKLILSNIKDVSCYSSSLLTLNTDGLVERYSVSFNSSSSSLSVAVKESFSDFLDKDVAGIEYNGHGGSYYYVYTAEGSAYAWGSSSSNGKLGLGTTSAVEAPQLIMLENVVDIHSTLNNVVFLTADGELYCAGTDNNYSSPYFVTSNIERIFYDYINSTVSVLTKDGKLTRISLTTGDVTVYSTDLSAMDDVMICGYYSSGIAIDDGKVYKAELNNPNIKLTLVPGIDNAKSVYSVANTHYIVTEDGLLYGLGKNNNNQMPGATTEADVTTPVMIPLTPLAEESVKLTSSNISQDNVLTDGSIELSFNKAIASAVAKLYQDGEQIVVTATVSGVNKLNLTRSGFEEGSTYELVFAPGNIHAAGNITNTEEIRITFTYSADGAVTTPDTEGDTTPEPEEDPTPEVEVKDPVIHQSQTDSSIERVYTAESFAAKVNEIQERTQYNPSFHGNAILNRISTDTNVERWFRPLAGGSNGAKIPLGGNYWGTTNQTLIELQMVDYRDFISYGRFMYEPYLTTAPEDTFPFVTGVTILNAAGEAVTTVGNEEITVRVTFNRDMDTSIPLQVRFGSAYPYGDYEIFGEYVDARTWEGTYTLKTTIENGNQYFSIANGCSATDDLELQPDSQRFGFVIDTTAAQALIMQGFAEDTGIQLRWTQDDFATLMGYNVYRSTKEDGLYVRLNSTVIPADTMEFFDGTVEPGVVYYYNFTVVQTDLNESTPSGKIVIMSKDTMAPDIYHTPVYNASTGTNLVISATVTDNLSIAYANLYYRTAGSGEWKLVRMNNLNSKYSAIIPASDISSAGLEYYIEAFDGVSYTYKGSADSPYLVSVQEKVDVNAMGDVNADGVINNLDAVLVLYAINDKYNMTAEEFARADLNGDGELWASEALRILQYVSGTVGSVVMS